MKRESGHRSPPFYQALVTKDRRFDGRVFFGVRTTGIYCRPICPARTPLEKNVAFFPTSAAAEEAGFRPCFRCRPETSPGTPAWLGTTATVSRALRLIAEGALDAGGVEPLASQLGITPRHLRRLFQEHLGASPQTIALVRRLDFARRLVDETDLPMTEIALGSGFESIRRFNDAFKKRFHRSPTEARKASGPRSRAGAVSFRIPYRPPLAWERTLAFFGGRAIRAVETVEGETYRRTFRLAGKASYFELRPVPGEMALELSLPSMKELPLLEIVGRVRAQFDLDADPLTIETHLSKDPSLARLVKKTPGLRIPGTWDGFELAIRALLGQQVSVQGATTLAARLAERFGEKVDFPERPQLTRLFPTPEALAAAEPADLGIPKARGEAIRRLSREVAEGKLSLRPGADLMALRQSLLALPGIGPWTAEYIALRALGDPDAFPDTDLVLRRELSASGAAARSEAWRPWRSYASLHFWNQASQKPLTRRSS
jgi:AraC family transcriptional regulator, regulatory protein of adaptative response / DNA-3-methyladenine glycosylase II